MAACAVEDVILTPVYYQTTDSMKQTQLSSFEVTNEQCLFGYHVNPTQMDSTTLFRNHELTKKRQFFRSNTYNTENELTRSIIDTSCSVQAVSSNNNEILTTTTTTTTQPQMLFLTDPTNNRRVPHFRTCFSYPATSPDSFPSNDDETLSPLKFTSLPTFTCPPAKRLRPQTLSFASTNLSVPVIPQTISPSLPTVSSSAAASSSSSISFIDSSELADKLNGNFQTIIFDCGSPFRHSENHIHNSNLLRVSDKISRKRLKNNLKKHLTIDIKQLNECDLIILYDDNTDNHNELSAGLKCAYEEIQRCITTKYPLIFILKDSFDYFLKLYPNLCESLQSNSSSVDDLSSQSTPISPDLVLQNYPMTHIINGIFIGSESNAKNLEELSSEQIRHIVNVTSHIPLYHSNQFHYYHIPADDTQKQNLLDYFDPAYTFINNAIKNNEKVLVHCVAGISRSPAIVISFLMRYAHMNMNDAYEFVKTKRSIVSPNLNFMGQLLQYEKNLREQK